MVHFHFFTERLIRMPVRKDKVVSFNYTLRDPQGEVIDTSEGGEPLTYLHGHGSLIPGLEIALEGKDVGQQLNVKVKPEQAYGPRDEKMVQAVPRTNFQGIDKIEPGMQFQAQTPNGPRVVRIVKVDTDNITVDANHPLAGMPLDFDVTIANVRDATPEEIAHGHVHGAGGHQH